MNKMDHHHVSQIKLLSESHWIIAAEQKLESLS